MAQSTTDQYELHALRVLASTVRQGLSLEGALEYCLQQNLAYLQLDFGAVYVRRDDYLIRVACLGLDDGVDPMTADPSLPHVPSVPDRGVGVRLTPDLPHREQVILVPPEPWPRRLFIASQTVHQGEDEQRGQRVWMNLPLLIDREIKGLLLLGACGASLDALPSMKVATKLAECLSTVVDNASRNAALRDLLNDTRDVIFRTDTHGRWVYLNPAWEETFGEPVARALGQRVVSYLAPERVGELGPGLEALVPRGSVIGRQTLPFRVWEDKTRWLEVQARLVFNDRGQVTGAAGVLRDVSRSVLQAGELRQANAELRERAAQLEEANRALAEADRLKSEFLATVSHELRTPLQFMLGSTELMLEGVPDEPTSGQREYLELLAQGCQRLQEQIDSILELAMIEAGRLTLEPRPTAVREVLGKLLGHATRQAARQGIDVRLVYSNDHELFALADPKRLQRVLALLVDNAIKFSYLGSEVVLYATPRRGHVPDPLSAAEAEPDPLYVQVTVVDQGQGVDAATQARLFRKFVQADGSDTREHGGIGLGLVISQALVERMGGQIALYSAGRGHGTRVGFTVPLTKRPEPS